MSKKQNTVTTPPKQFTDKELAAIEEYGTLQFSLVDIAILMDCEQTDLNEGAPARSFMRGRLLAQALVRKSILDQAKNGSSPAHKEFFKLVEKSAPEFDSDEPEDFEEDQ